MAGRESYETSQAISMSNVRLAYSADGTAMYTPLGPPTPPTYGGGGGGGDSSGAAVVNSTGGGEVMKRKRGRPRKYAPDGSMPGLSSPPPQPLQAVPGVVQTGGFPSQNSVTPGGGAVQLSSGKKPRGRPPGSGNKQHQVASSGSPGVGFTPHIIDVKAGEDVLVKLMTFSQNSARTICILSASGSISNVTLRQAATSGGTVTYEGRFDILSLSGSFLLSDIGGQRSRTGGLSISLAGPDGRVLGGGVAGLLIAATPVQIIVGTFVEAGAKQLKSGKLEVVNAQMKPLSGTSAGGSLSESSCGLGSPIDQSNNGNPQGMASMPWR